MVRIELPAPDDAAEWFGFLTAQQAASYPALPSDFVADQRARYYDDWVVELAESFARQRAELSTEPDPVAALPQLAGPRFAVARWSGRIVGVASSSPGPQDWEIARGLVPAPADRELARLYVTSEFHGTGLADRLLAAVDDGDPMYLWIILGNNRAEAFYRRRGFELLPEIFEAGEDWGSAHMRRMLRA